MVKHHQNAAFQLVFFVDIVAAGCASLLLNIVFGALRNWFGRCMGVVDQAWAAVKLYPAGILFGT